MKLIPVDKSRHLFISRHALERGELFGLPHKRLMWHFYNSEPDPAPPGTKKYGDRQEGIRYYRSGTVCMVVSETIDKRSMSPAYKMVTVYDQKMDIPSNRI